MDTLTMQSAGRMTWSAGQYATFEDERTRPVRDLLAALPAIDARSSIWRTTYHHALAGGAGAIVEWFKGSGLRPFVAALDADERGAFLARYQAALTCAYPERPDGSVLLPFPRLFMVALK